MGVLISLIALLSASATPPRPLVLTEGSSSEHAAGWARAVGFDTVVSSALSGYGADALLVVPEAGSFPACAVDPLVAFLGRGGHLMAVGGVPFHTLEYQATDGRWLSYERYLVETIREHAFVPDSNLDTTKLRRETDRPKTPYKLELIDGGLRFETDLSEQSIFDTVAIPTEPAPAAHNVLRFRAAGLGVADRLLVEVRELDGSRWMAVVPLEADAREYGLHAGDFELYRESIFEKSAREGTALRFDQAKELSVGFALSHHPLRPGHWGVAITSVGTGHSNVERVRDRVPALTGLSPEYSLFETRPSRLEPVDWVADLPFGTPGTVVSSYARPMGAHPDRDYAWQPLVKAYDTNGRWTATPVACTWRNQAGALVFVGFRPTDTELEVLVRRVAERIARGAGLAAAPGPLLEPTPDGAAVVVDGGHFKLEGKRWIARGMNYFPSYVAGQGPPEYYSAWLRPHGYIPAQIDIDLDVLRSTGVNLVSVSYMNPVEAPQLRDFVARAQRRGLHVNVYLNDANPIQPSGADDLSKRLFTELVRAANLAGIPAVFGYELAWEPHFGSYAERCPHDGLFEAWIVEQYGSVERAEAVWGIAAPRRERKLTGPSDEQLIQQGPHRLMVAAYRRFTDDLVSRRYREVIRLIRAIDDTHLMSVRTGWGGTGSMWIAPRMPFQLTSGAAHLDLITPEGYGYDAHNIGLAGYVSQYARWAGNGKPVFWGEFGMSVWNAGDGALQKQRGMYEAFHGLVGQADIDGSAGWWFAGGYRVDEKSDFGYVNPDRSLRPAAEFHRDMTGFPEPFKPGPEILMDPDEHPAGIANLVANRSDEFVKAWKDGLLPTLHTAGTGTTSKNCPLTGLGGVPYTAPQPVEYLNAEVALAPSSGGMVSVTLINTGEATWSDDCRLRVETTDGPRDVPLPADVPRFGRVTVTFPEDGFQSARLHAERLGEFGERQVKKVKE